MSPWLLTYIIGAVVSLCVVGTCLRVASLKGKYIDDDVAGNLLMAIIWPVALAGLLVAGVVWLMFVKPLDALAHRIAKVTPAEKYDGPDLLRASDRS